MADSHLLDWDGKSVQEFIGRRTTEPRGAIVDGYVDACDVMLFTIRGDDGTMDYNVPRTVVVFEDR